MFVTFTSSTHVGTGFLAKIHETLEKQKDPLATFCTVTNPCKADEGHCYHDQQCAKGLKCGQNNCPVNLGYANDTNCCYEHCNDWLNLANGTISSPNYPNTYPKNMECSWTIVAPENKIITFQVQDLEVNTKQMIDNISVLSYLPKQDNQ